MKMEYCTKISALLFIFMFFTSSAATAVNPHCSACGHGKPPNHGHKGHKGKGGGGGGGLLPPINLPPVTLPPVTFPPIITNPPHKGGGGGGKGACPPPPAAACPIDTLKLGACVDLLGGLVHIGLGDPVVNECCPILQGLVEVEAAVCLCTTLKLKLLNLNIYVPLALQLLITCGKTPPPGYTCTL